MILIPAIDILNGKVVRLIQGAYDREVQYAEGPAYYARKFESEGAKWIHVVDLNGARAGEVRNLEAVRSIREATRAAIEFGGGLRSRESVAAMLSLGVNRLVLGTRGLDEDFLSSLVREHGEKIAVSVDVRQGKVQAEGWTRGTEIRLEELCGRLADLGLCYLIYTDIARDGALAGPNLAALEGVLAHAGPVRVILSGGISSLDDVKAVTCIRAPNFYGAIVGRALYEGRFQLKDALRVTGETVS